VADELGFHWIEEPLHRGDAEGYARLRQELARRRPGARRLRVAGGELNGSWGEFQRFAEQDALDVYQPDAILAEGSFGGGISLVERLLPRIRALPSRPEYCPHTWTTGVGFLVNLHLLGLVPPQERHFIEYPVEGPWVPESWGCILRGLPVASGADPRLTLPEGPGLGAEVDWARVRRHGRRIYHGTRARVALSVIRDRGLRVAKEIAAK
jgi:D-galactarolactone cycloisomerase